MLPNKLNQEVKEPKDVVVNKLTQEAIQMGPDIAKKAMALFELGKHFFKDKETLSGIDIQQLNDLQRIYKEIFFKLKTDGKETKCEYIPEAFCYRDDDKRPRLVPHSASLEPLNYESNYGNNEITAHARTCIALICEYQTKRSKSRRRLRKAKPWDGRGLFCYFLKQILTQFTRCDLQDTYTLTAIAELLHFVSEIRRQQILGKKDNSSIVKLLADVSIHLEQIKAITVKNISMLAAREYAQNLIDAMQMVFYQGIAIALRAPSLRPPVDTMNLVTLAECEDEQVRQLNSLQRCIHLLAQMNPLVHLNNVIESTPSKPFLFEYIAGVWGLSQRVNINFHDQESKKTLAEPFLKNEDNFYGIYLHFLALLEQLGENSKYVVLSHRLAGETGNWGIYYQLGKPINRLCEMINKLADELHKLFKQINNYLQTVKTKANKQALKLAEEWEVNIAYIFHQQEAFHQAIKKIKEMTQAIQSKYIQDEKTAKEQLQKRILQMALLIEGVNRAASHLSQMGVDVVKQDKNNENKEAKDVMKRKDLLFAIQESARSEVPQVYMTPDSFLKDASGILAANKIIEENACDKVEKEFKVDLAAQTKLEQEVFWHTLHVVEQRIATEDKNKKLERGASKQWVENKAQEFWKLANAGQSAKLADWLEKENLQQKLFAVIETSKKDEEMKEAATDAITILNGCGVNLSGYDFSGVNIPRADLRGALLHGTDFTGANLTDVNFQGAWLAGAKLHKALLQRADFGERPYIETKGVVVRTCACSADGKWIAVGGLQLVDNRKMDESCDIQVYDAKTRKTVATLQGHSMMVNSVVWSSAGDRLASGSSDGTVRVWDMKSYKILHCFKGHKNDVNSVAWHPASRMLASGGDDSKVRVWDLTANQEIKSIEHNDNVKCVAWDCSGKKLAAGDSCSVVIWDTGNYQQYACYKSPLISAESLNMKAFNFANYVNSVAWDPSGKKLAWGTKNGLVVLWEVKINGPRKLGSHKDSVSCVVWDVTGQKLISASSDTVRMWDTEKKYGDIEGSNEIQCLQGHSSDVTSVTCGPKMLISGSWDKTVRFWNIENNRGLRDRPAHRSLVHTVAWNVQGTRMASGSADGTVRIWDSTNGKELYCLQGNSEVQNIAWSPDSKMLASRNNHNILLWNTTVGTQVDSIDSFMGMQSSIVWDRNGNQLAYVDGYKVKIWDIENKEEVCSLPKQVERVTALAWSPANRNLACANWEGVNIWDSASGNKLCSLEKKHLHYVACLAWSPDGKLLASGSKDKTVQVCNSSDGKALHCLKGHTELVTSLAWHREKNQLASASLDKTVRVWDLLSGKELYCLTLPQEIRSIAWYNQDNDSRLGVAFGKSIACFVLKPRNDTYKFELQWLASEDSTLHLHDADMTDAIGLDEDNYDLLKQRSAKVTSRYVNPNDVPVKAPGRFGLMPPAPLSKSVAQQQLPTLENKCFTS